ncbi:hypothetical protein ACROYT_G014257 [Oculina patagonica]
MASSNRIYASSGSEIQQFIRTVLNAVTNLQPRGGQSNEDSSTQQFPSIQHEISSQFNLPRGREENANFNPCQNYSSILRLVQGVGNRRRRGNFQPITSTSTVQEPDYSYKDVCLIPSTDINQVPRGGVKASLVESGLYVDAFEVDKAWSEVTLSNSPELFSLTSSPFLLGGVIQQHLDVWEQREPELVAQIRKSLNVDDLISGASIVPQAQQQKEGSIKIFGDAKFVLHK